MPETAFCFATPITEIVTFSPGTLEAAERCLAQEAGVLFHMLLREQEHEPELFAAKQVLDVRLQNPAACEDELSAASGMGGDRPIADGIMNFLDRRASELRQIVAEAAIAGLRVRRAVMRERAAIALVAGCWADIVSQPATQPGGSVNLLFGQHFAWLGEGLPERSIPERRKRAMEEAGIFLPAIIDQSFPDKADLSTSTALLAAYLISLSRYPANYYPETLGTHVAYHMLGLDTALYGIDTPIGKEDLTALLEKFLDEISSRSDRNHLIRRLLRAVGIMVDLEMRQAALLAEISQRTAAQTLDSRVAELVLRHAPMAGAHHNKVRVGNAAMSDIFAGNGIDIQDFMNDFRKSFHLREGRDGSCPFARALKFGGPMFGIFTAEESETLVAWAREAAKNPGTPAELTNIRPDDAEGEADLAALRSGSARNVVFDATPPADDREFFFRLVNIENFPGTLHLARLRADAGLASARILFKRGDQGRYTDGSFFQYTPHALLKRVDRIYWDKLVRPYKPLEEIPDRDEVIFGQKTFALGNLVDGSWSYRIANTGRYDRISDGKLFLIHADEMGLGDTRKNHITLIHDVLESMNIKLPHISDHAFLGQDELPDEVYPFAVNQLSLSLFPDSRFAEIVGYNLGIEMFGLGEVRMHEIQKLKKHRINPIYEEAHLSIDNASSGHARQSAEIVNDYLDDIGRRFGEERQQEEWLRVWSGYCSFAQFVEKGNIDMEAGTPFPARAAAAQSELAVTTI